MNAHSKWTWEAEGLGKLIVDGKLQTTELEFKSFGSVNKGMREPPVQSITNVSLRGANTLTETLSHA